MKRAAQNCICVYVSQPTLDGDHEQSLVSFHDRIHAVIVRALLRPSFPWATSCLTLDAEPGLGIDGTNPTQVGH